MFKQIKKLFSSGPKKPIVEMEYIPPKNSEMSLGDGKAVFFGEATDEEYLEFEREEQGTKKWYDRLKNL